MTTYFQEERIPLNYAVYSEAQGTWNPFTDMFGIKLLIHFQTSIVKPLKFWNG